MAVDSKCYRYHKSDVYPRVHYFQRMLGSLLPRFMRVVGYFDEPYQDIKRINDIEKTVKMLLRAPCVLLISNTGQFDISRTAALKKAYTSTAVEELEQLCIDDLPMTVVVYHHQGTDKFEDELELSVKETEDTIRKLPINGHKSDYVLRTDRDVTSRLFIACDSEKGEEELNTFKGEMSSKLAALFQDESLIKERLLVGDCVELGVSISMYLESIVFLGFDNIDNYLREFRKHDPTCYNVSKSITVDKRILDFFKCSLTNIDSLKLALQDLSKVKSDEENISLSINNDLFTIFIVFITYGLKGIVVQILFERFSLSQILTHQCLVKCDFHGMVKTAMENDNHLKDQIYEIVYPEKERISPNVKDKGDKLTEALVIRLQSVFEAVEKEVLTVNKSVEIVKKMNFEISGYYKSTKSRKDRITPKVSFSKELQTELLKYEDVLGCGFVYGIFEVLIREECKDNVEETIKELMKQHRYIGQYNIKRAQVNYSLV